jgi:Ca-activated chloride channel family protein
MKGAGWCAAIAVWASSLVLAQPTFRATVDAVRIDVSVMNGIVPVAGLTKDRFVVTDNGVEQVVESVAMDTVPLDLTLVLDNSGSLAGERLTNLIDAAAGLVKTLQTADTASLLTFSDPVRLAVKSARARQPLLDALAKLQADGMTSLNDAIFFGLQMRPPAPGDARQVMLVFSDGRDTASWLTATDALEATRRAGLVVHVIELVQDQYAGISPGSQPRPSEFLGKLASAGGGRRWFATSPRDLRQLFGTALNELRARYLLTYYPANVQREGWHDVKVTLKGARGDVTARPGYFVAAQ